MRPPARVHHRNAPVTTVNAFTNKAVFYGCADGTTGIVDISAQSTREWKTHSEPIINVGFSTRSCTVVSTARGAQGACCFYDLRGLSDVSTIAALTTVAVSDVTAACVHDEVPLVAVGTEKHTVRLLDMATGAQVQEVKLTDTFLRFKSTPVSAIAFPPFGLSLAITTASFVDVCLF